MSELYVMGVLFTLGYIFGDYTHKDTWGNAALTLALAFAFPFYWGLTLALIMKPKKGNPPHEV